MIRVKDLAYEYFDRDEYGNLTEMINAIRGIDFEAAKGEFIVIAGENGSGKSTFARILNRLLVPIEGTILIGGYNALDPENVMNIRKMVGMVYQDPDDQMIGSVCYEEIAFGAENIGTKQSELWDVVLSSIIMAGLVNGNEQEAKKLAWAFAHRQVNELSGGEKQKLAVAAILAMKPECIILDESTSMLDANSRYELYGIMRDLKEKHGMTIILITHLMDELLWADRIYIMYRGNMVMSGTRRAVLAHPDRLKEYGLSAPEMTRILKMLHEKKVISSEKIYNLDDLVKKIKDENKSSFDISPKLIKTSEALKVTSPASAILFDGVTFYRGEKKILDNVSLTVNKGEYVAVIGGTGSGKSTLLQHIPALIRPQEGAVYVDGLDVFDSSTDIRRLRKKIGYVFQFSKHQIFSKNVYEDVVFGPRNMGISKVLAEKRAYEAIKLVGLSEDVYDMPVSRLSGGQIKRVAIAGVLAMSPEYLILDEPTAGLDPRGREQLLELIDELHEKQGITIILVTHDVSEVAKRTDRVVYLEEGRIAAEGRADDVFVKMLQKNNSDLMVPVANRLLFELRKNGLEVECTCDSPESAVNNILEAI